ncbi:MAG: hypothetical protein WB816_14295, partial [Methylocystis sp.]
FKAAAAEGAAVELKLRLLAGKIPALQKYAHQKKLEDIEADLIKHFDGSLSVEEKQTLRFCRQLRNKVLHPDVRDELVSRLGKARFLNKMRHIGLRESFTRWVRWRHCRRFCRSSWRRRTN